MVLRSCTTEKFGNQCGKLLFEYGEKNVRKEVIHGCIAICDTDGCNRAQEHAYSAIVLMVNFVFYMLYVIFNFGVRAFTSVTSCAI